MNKKPVVPLPAVVIFACFALSFPSNLQPAEPSVGTFNNLSATVSSH